MKNIRPILLILLISTISVEAQRRDTKEIDHSEYGTAIVQSYFDKDDVLMQEIIYTNNSLHTSGNAEVGINIQYHKNGKISVKGGFTTKFGQIDSFGTNMETRKKQGRWMQYDEDGNIISTAYFKDDKEEGKFVMYHPNGNIYSIITYEGGIVKGDSEHYFANNHLHKILRYKDGLPFNILEFCNMQEEKIEHGTFKDGNGTLDYYNLESGTYRETRTYENGLLKKMDSKTIPSAKGDIIEKTYKNNNGTVSKIVRLLNGKLEGLQEEFDYKGNLKKANFYSNGKKNGTHTVYNDDGSMFWQDTYVKDKKIGPFKHTREGREGREINEDEILVIDEGFYDEDEKMTGVNIGYLGKDRVIVSSGEYEKNYKVGIWKFYNSDGILNREKNYFNFDSNKMIEKEYYVSNGSSILKSVVNYIDRKADGKYKEYHPNGKLKKSGSFLEGKENGQWKSYDENGKLTEETEYNNGRIVE